MRKKVLMILVSLLCIVGITACQADEQTTEEESEEYLVGFSAIDMENPYFITLEGTVRDVLEETGDFELITEDPGTDADTQSRQILDMIDQGIDAIILSPVDWEKITVSLKELQDAGVKIINVDTMVKDMDYVDAYIGSDNYRAGQICGEDLLARCPDGGKIAILESPSMNSVTDRIAGFEDTLAESGVPFEVVARADTMGELQSALEETQTIFEENEDLVAIMCGNDQMAVGAQTAANLADQGDVYIYGVDGSPDIKKELRKVGNQIAGTAAQSPITMGEDAADTVIRILTGQDYEEEIYEDVFMINEDNLDQYGTDGWQ